MKSDRVRSFAIGGVEHLFSPGGLPLTGKAEAVAPTTSILVRGGPGVGKTTLAVGLAHGIARHLDGAVLYLATEFVPAEIQFKGKVLGVDDVMPWERLQDAKTGSVVVQHLAAEPESNARAPMALNTRAIEAVWRLIEQSGNRIRAAVIDAMTPSLDHANPSGLRDDVLTLVQALESMGVSPVLVQEEAIELDWLAYVVDVVFELGYFEDPDTGELHRKLTLTKSRYSMSLAGPHDYGLDMGRGFGPTPLP
jgi:KaiC/GvpD/RAD55 family RecA-like ATPase